MTGPMPDPVSVLRDVQWSATDGEGVPCCPLCRAARTVGVHADGCRVAGALATGTATRWRHRRRGSTYVEVGHATLQHSGGVLADQDGMMVYRSEGDGALGVRALLEFTDGRFERLD